MPARIPGNQERFSQQRVTSNSNVRRRREERLESDSIEPGHQSECGSKNFTIDVIYLSEWQRVISTVFLVQRITNVGRLSAVTA